MNNFLKNLTILILLFILSFAGNCSDPPPPQPSCDWTDEIDIIFGEVSLYYPLNTPFEFKNFFPFNPIKDLNSIVFFDGGIQITAIGSECTGKSVITYYKDDANKVGISAIYDVPHPKDYLLSTVRVSIRSKKFYDNNINLVYMYWNETIDPKDYSNTDHVISNGTMIPTSDLDFKNFKEPIYIDGQIKDQV